MLVRITSAKCIGIEARAVTVEVNVSNGIGIHLVGLADVAVKESLLRTVTALQSVGFRVPGKKIVINLAPADVHKRGSGYDLPIALGIIAASGQMEMPESGRFIIVGELGLDGTVRAVKGALPIAEYAGRNGFEGCILPLESATDTAGFNCCKVYGVRNIAEVLAVVCGRPDRERLVVDESFAVSVDRKESDDEGIMDFAEIVGQQAAKRGVEIAACGGHNIIMVGPPGSGKSSLARAMCRILPPLSPEEALQTCKIFSAAGRGIPGCERAGRPFRAPHVTTSVPALVGGGSDNMVPGEISLAHNGILFLDEFCEIPRHTTEVLRAPLEDGRIVLSRLKTKVEFPASFTLVAATNPCPCGYYGEGDRCTCTVGARKAYLARLSGPIMDRIDIQIYLHPVPVAELMNGARQECSESVARRVAAVRRIQKERFLGTGIFCNARMNGRMLKKFCPLDAGCSEFLEKMVDRAGMSARAVTRIVKLSRTISDIAAVIESGAGGTDAGELSPADLRKLVERPITIDDISEAVSYRFLDKRVL